MDPLTLAIVKCIATTCLKLYITSMFGGGDKLVYDKAELGYKVPSWYMQPARGQTFCAFGTSMEGDEFESIDDARKKAMDGMLKHIRLSNQKISKEVRYDRTSVKQQRLIDLFVRGDGLDDYVAAHAKVDKKQLVKVGDGEMRAFVRLAMDADAYIEYQENTVQALKTRLMRLKSDDILDEMSREIANFDRSGYTTEEPQTSAEPETPKTEMTEPEAAAETPAAGGAKSQSAGAKSQSADSVFDELEQESDASGK